MNAKLFREGEFFADVFIHGMHRNGGWEFIQGTHEWVTNPAGSWFRLALLNPIEDTAGAYSLFLENGEVFTLGPLKVDYGGDGLPSVHAPILAHG